MQSFFKKKSRTNYLASETEFFHLYEVVADFLSQTKVGSRVDQLLHFKKIDFSNRSLLSPFRITDEDPNPDPVFLFKKLFKVN